MPFYFTNEVIDMILKHIELHSTRNEAKSQFKSIYVLLKCYCMMVCKSLLVLFFALNSEMTGASASNLRQSYAKRDIFLKLKG